MLDLLKLNVSPEALVLMLRSMTSPPGHHGDDSTQHTRHTSAERRYDSSSHVSDRDRHRGVRSHTSQSSSRERMRGSAVAAQGYDSGHSHRDPSPQMRPPDKRGGSSASYSDVNVTRRPRSTASDFSSFEDRDRVSKKRYSHR